MSISIIGDVMLDEYWFGKSYRISPEAPIPIVTDVVKTTTLGGAGNVFRNLNNLCTEVFLYDPDIIKPHKLRVFVDNYLITRVDTENYQAVEINFSQIPESTKYCILSDYNKGVLHDSQSIIDALNKKGVLTIVDPKKKFENYQNCWLLKANKKEFEEEINADLNSIDIEERLNHITQSLNISHIIVTTGGGSTYYYCLNSKEFKEFKTVSGSVIDVTGAGDVFISVLTYLLFLDYSVEKSIEIANKLATFSVTKLGTYVVTKEDLGSQLG